MHWTRLLRDRKVGADLVHNIEALLVRGTLRGETLLHVARPAHTGAPPPTGDRSIVMQLVPGAAREPTGATLASELPVPLREVARPNSAKSTAHADRRVSRRVVGLLIASGLAWVVVMIWSLLKGRCDVRRVFPPDGTAPCSALRGLCVLCVKNHLRNRTCTIKHGVRREHGAESLELSRKIQWPANYANPD